MPDTAGQFSDLFAVYATVAAVAVAAVFAAVAVAVVRFRARDGDAWPARAGGSDAPRLELAYVGALALVAAGLVTLTFRAEWRADASAPAAARVDVVGGQWEWSFRYPGSDRVVEPAGDAPPVLVLPAGETVRFTLRSIDVVHSFGIPDARFKRYAYPDRTTTFTLRFAEPGRHRGFCYQFCGWQHKDMRFTVRVVAADAYRRWLAGGEL